MTFQRNRFGVEQDIIEISEKDLADKVCIIQVSPKLSLSKINIHHGFFIDSCFEKSHDLKQESL